MLKKIYTLAAVLFVVLSLYSINIMTFTVADAILLCLFPVYILNSFVMHKSANITIHLPLFIIVLYITIHMCIIILIDQSGADLEIFMTTMRYVSYLLFLALFVETYFDIQLGWKLLKNISIISTLFLYVQYILMKFGNYYLSGFIPGLPLSIESLNSLGQEYASGYLTRPRSIFQEPAHYASFVLLYFGIALFQNYRKEKWGLILTGIGLIISGSSTGILTEIGLLLIWIIWLLKDILNRNRRSKAITALFITAFSAAVIANTKTFKYAVSRMFGNKSSFSGRFGNYSKAFSSKNSTVTEMLFGHGIKGFNEYIPAIPRIYLSFGIVILVIFLLYSTYKLFKKKGYKKIALLILLVSTPGTEIILGKFILLYLPFIIEYKSREKSIMDLIQ